MESISSRLVSYREGKGLSLETVAEQLEINPVALKQWEDGVSIPAEKALKSLADLYGVSVQDIMGKEEKAPFEKVQMEKTKASEVVEEQSDSASIIENIINIVWVPLVVALYLIIGYALENKVDAVWWKGLVLFIQIPVIPSLLKAIRKRNLYLFLYPVLVTGVYFTLVALLPHNEGWHPWWVLFITIPGYYYAAATIHAKRKK